MLDKGIDECHTMLKMLNSEREILFDCSSQRVAWGGEMILCTLVSQILPTKYIEAVLLPTSQTPSNALLWRRILYYAVGV